jgi:hypothetical protein
MAEKVADAIWTMLADAGVCRCYGIIGDVLNPVIDALRRNGRVEFVYARHEEAGVFAAVAGASLTGNPVAVCGTVGPGAIHLPNGLVDAQREGAPVIAIVGDRCPASSTPGRTRSRPASAASATSPTRSSPAGPKKAGHDPVDTTALHVPDLGLIVSSDVASNHCHMFTAATTAESRAEDAAEPADGVD